MENESESCIREKILEERIWHRWRRWRQGTCRAALPGRTALPPHRCSSPSTFSHSSFRLPSLMFPMLLLSRVNWNNWHRTVNKQRFARLKINLFWLSTGRSGRRLPMAALISVWRIGFSLTISFRSFTVLILPPPRMTAFRRTSSIFGRNCSCVMQWVASKMSICCHRSSKLGCIQLSIFESVNSNWQKFTQNLKISLFSLWGPSLVTPAPTSLRWRK